MKPLNLAERPFRNERLGETLFGVAALGLIGLTVWHALVIRDLLPARTSTLHREVAALQAERGRLREEAGTLRTETPPAPVLAQWNLVKELVDRRAFSWTGLFARLEDVIPQDVRLTSISPSVRKGQMELDVSAVARRPEAGWDFVRVLEGGGDFYDVYPKSEADRAFQYTMRYRPQAPAAVVGPPAPPVEDEAVEEDESAEASTPPSAAPAPPAPRESAPARLGRSAGPAFGGRE